MPSLASSSSPASDWTTSTSPKTQSITAVPGNVVIVFGGTEDATTTLVTPSDGSNVYSLLKSSVIASYCAGYAWSSSGQIGQLVITTASLPNATLGTAYSITEAATGGSGSGYTWAVTSGALPGWAALNPSTGVISGTPNATGTASFTVTVTDSAANTASQAQSITTASISTQPLGPGGTWTLLFEDQFNGTSLDGTRWLALDQSNVSGSPAASSNVSVSGGFCNLQNSAAAGATINSKPSLQGWGADPSNGVTVALGNCVEAKISFAGPSGDSNYNWPAFWISGANWPANGEEDIFEGYNGTPSALNYHNSAGANNGPFPSGNWCNSFHTYTCVRGSSTISVYWDGNLVRSVTRNDNGGPQSIMVSIAQGGGASATGTTSRAQVDYVRLWSPA